MKNIRKLYCIEEINKVWDYVLSILIPSYGIFNLD